MFVRANFVDSYLQGMRDRSMRSGTELAREIQLTDWSTAGNLSNRSSGVQILRDICTRFGRYLYSAKCRWIISRLTNRAFNCYFLGLYWIDPNDGIPDDAIRVQCDHFTQSSCLYPQNKSQVLR